MIGHEPFQSSLFVMGIVVDVGMGMFLEMSGDKIHEPLEGLSFFMTVMGPIALERRLFPLECQNTEQVFQAIFRERVSLHIEEDITCIGFRQSEKSSFFIRIQGQEIEAVCSGLPFPELQCCLMAEFCKGLRNHFREIFILWEPGQGFQGRYAMLVQFPDLWARDIGHLA